jgi:hypothetical protein
MNLTDRVFWDYAPWKQKLIVLSLSRHSTNGTKWLYEAFRGIM